MDARASRTRTQKRSAPKRASSSTSSKSSTSSTSKPSKAAKAAKPQATKAKAHKPLASLPLHVDPTAPHIDGEALVRAEQCIALLQRRLIKPMSRGGPKSELSLTQYHALSFLAARGQANIGELREILGFAQSTTSVLVDKLRRHGLVDKLKDAHDQRVACIVPLPKGLRMVQRYRKNAETNLLALRAVLGPGAVRDVFDALERALIATAPLEDPRVTRAAALAHDNSDDDDDVDADDVDADDVDADDVDADDSDADPIVAVGSAAE
jgi:DNA-binding MarR family transcriptional regulator